MNRVGIIPPPVTISADNKRLKAGMPAPYPFLLLNALGTIQKNVWRSKILQPIFVLESRVVLLSLLSNQVMNGQKSKTAVPITWSKI